MARSTVFIPLVLGLALFGSPVHAQSPREALTQMVAQLQTAPGNDSLRADIIKLALTLDPPPALPEEAERRMARGTAAFKAATSPADYAVSAAEFEQATMAAPWYGDAYFNLGTAQDKAEKYSDALRSLRLALLASPDDKALKTLLYEVEFRNEQHSPAAEAARQAAIQREKDEALIKRLDGTTFVTISIPEDHSSDTSPQGQLDEELHIHGHEVTQLFRWISVFGHKKWERGHHAGETEEGTFTGTIRGRRITGSSSKDGQPRVYDIAEDGESVTHTMSDGTVIVYSRKR